MFLFPSQNDPRSEEDGGYFAAELQISLVPAGAKSQ